MNIKKLTITTFLLLFSITIVSAQFGGYYGSPLDILENEWVMFGIIFLVFFGVIFFAVSKTFRDSRAVAAIVAAGISLFISLTLARRGWLYGYAGDELGSWLLIAAALIGFGFLIKLAWENFGHLGTITVLIGTWVLLHYLDPFDVLPYNAPYQIFDIYEIIAGGWGLAAAIIISIFIVSSTQRGEKTIRGVLNKALDYKKR